ncbi:response regulator transcription factor [Chitinophaga agrisoli]|uniref:Response regulator transcription factor n=1 Tax=Chitinophaga agrisoli TaxID=2607653 RepID=A0A5B2VQV2_9BACT|nr:response regulator transcription factor [Chitinophaga agrisoli]KAA2241415.1 response regulator transcription factor [Chitinophaga agrisoli]
MKKVRRDTAGHLNGTNILEVAGTHSDTQLFVQQLAKDICNIFFMDVDIPGVTAVEAASIVKAAYPEMNVLLLAVNKDSHSVTSVSPRSIVYEEQGPSPASLSAFISQVYDAAVEHNIAAVQKVLAFINRRAQHDITQYGLSPREQEVLDRLVDGHTYKKIAELCHISVGTVRSHIMNIYRKLEVNSRSAAIVKAMRG